MSGLSLAVPVAVAAVAAAALSGIAAAAQSDEEVVPAPARQRQLVHLVRNDCGACHGLTLAGGLGPALLPEALRSKSEEYLRYVILRGRSGTAMPGWQGLLSEPDAQWIARKLREGFPDER